MPAKNNDITDLLGKPTEEETGLTEDSMNAMQQGLGLPNGEDNGEGNPLEKMDEISKSKKDVTKQGDKNLNADILNQMFMTGDNIEGMFTPNEEKEIDGVKLHEDQDEKAKANLNGKVEPKGKYKDQFKKDFLKHPDQYKIMTPKGEMTVAEAMKKGYDPMTKTFRKEHDSDTIKEKHLSQLNDADREGLERLTNPGAAQVAPADAERYGLNQNSPFIKQQEQPIPGTIPPQEGAQSTQPMMPPAGGAPVGSPMPGAEESQAAGGADLAALLGQGGNV